MLHAQTPLNNQIIKWTEGCDSTFVFEVTYKEALKFLKDEDNSESIDKFLYHHVATFKNKWNDAPSQGHFIYATISKNRINYRYVPIMPFQVFLFQEYGILSLQVLDNEGEVRSDAKVRIQNGKWRLFDSHIAYDTESKVYRTDDWSEKENRILTVQYNKFTAIFDLTKEIIKPSYANNYGRDDDDDKPDFYSYMITDKNKYKPGEKVRFKSYALTGGKKPIKKKLELWMQKPGGYYEFRKIADIEPYNPGGFASELVLHDSLKLILDKSYQLQLRDAKARIVAHSSFMYEDYQLYDYKIETRIKDFTQYYPNENEIEIKVTDPNNLIMPDMKATVVISRGEVRKSYTDFLIVPNVIHSEIVNLNNDTPTTYKIPASLFDKTDCTYNIHVHVMTPEGQALATENRVSFYRSYYDIKHHVQDSTLVFNFTDLGVSKNIAATISIDRKEAKDITLPHTVDFKQNVNSYTISVPEYKTTKFIQVSNIYNNLDIVGGIKGDSLSIELVNPLNLDVTWYMYEGNTLLEKGSGREIDIKKAYIDLDVSYFLEIFFTQGGEDMIYRRVFSPKKEYLNIDWNMPERVYPGQSVDSRIKITDSRGSNVKGVDITAFAYNSQLNYRVPELPYYGNTAKGREKRDSYEIDEKNAHYSEALTQNNYGFWNQIADLDANPYYQFTFPKPMGKFTHNFPDHTPEGVPYHDVFKYLIDTPDGTTEFAPYIMQDGYSVEIYSILLDEKPIYFNWTNQPKAYSFLVDSEQYHKISIRLHDRIIIIDKYCFVQGKKTILSINLNDMPKSSFVRTIMISRVNDGTNKNPIWTYKLTDPEYSLYSKYISSIPIIDDRFTYLTQHSLAGNSIIPIYHPNFGITYGNRRETNRIVGPLDEGTYSYMDGVEYLHEGGFRYQYAKNVVYKYPEILYPKSLKKSTTNELKNINDLYLTSTEFGRKIGLTNVEEEKWFPDIINLTDTKLHVPRDKEESGVRAIIMKNNETNKFFIPVYKRRTLGAYGSEGLYGLKGMEYGNYDIFVLYNNGNYLKHNDLTIAQGNYIELKMNHYQEHLKDSMSTEWLKYQPSFERMLSSSAYNVNLSREFQNIGKKHFNPSNDVRGVVVDGTGERLIGVSIHIKDTQAGTISDIDGEFILDLHGSENTLVFSYIGFEPLVVKVTRGSTLDICLKESSVMLDEAVVIGYGTSKRSYLTGSISSVLQGKMAGLTTNTTKEEADNSHTDEEQVKDDGSEELYKELMQLNGMRSNFSDVGFWEPKLVTDKKGEAHFSVTFPDNITQWQAVVYAMNRKLKTGTLYKNISSYKPLMAEIKTPQFLTEGDSSLFATYIRNYTKDKEIDGTITFVNNGDSVLEEPIHFESSYQKYLAVVAPSNQDSLTFSYRFTRNDGYSDGEQRSISLEKQGTEVAEGSLRFLRNNDKIEIVPETDEEIEVSITGKQIDIYMGAAYYLMGYKYACNEQLASKLIGLLNYRLYSQFQEQSFKYDKNVIEIINRLLKNQNRYKLWSWWGNSPNTSMWMSAHILRALNMAKNAGYRVDLNIDKNQYEYTDIHTLRNTSLSDIDYLNALIDCGVKQNYEEAIAIFEKKIAEDEDREEALVLKYKKTKNPKDYYVRRSYLTQKLTLIEMRQKLGLEYSTSLITDNLEKDVFGAVQVKDSLQPTYWYYGNDAANIISYRIARKDPSLRQYMDGIQMYILASKRYGWNTYQASSALMTILPDLLGESTTVNNQATVSISGKENKQLKEFPYHTTVRKDERLLIEKESGMPLIFSAHTMKRRSKQHFGDAFDITTSIDAKQLEKGVPVTMEVKVNVKQDNAEHVIIEVPIPAGCSYENKNQSYGSYEVYREYFKEKVAVFSEKLPKGEYTYTFKLLPRYTGVYTLNPAKIEMMYFPVINSNNDLKKVEIVE